MLEIRIPSIKTFFEDKTYSSSFVNTLFKKIKEKREESIDLLLGETKRRKLYLVLFEGDPLGAFYIEEDIFQPIGGRDYFHLLNTLEDVHLSFYAIDPVFAKCLLTPSQNKPAYRGEINVKELKKRVELIRADRNENIILLKDQNEISFFYFKYGKGIDSYFYHQDKKPDEEDIGDQFLRYVLSHDLSLLNMEIYHNSMITPLLESPLTLEDISEGILSFFLNQKSKTILTPSIDPDTTSPSSKNIKGKWYFELIGGEQMGRRVALNKPQLTIGRMKADLLLADVKISRHHAMIEQTEQGYRLTDLGSTNGSFINGQSVRTQLLKPGDVIRLGSTLIKVLVE